MEYPFISCKCITAGRVHLLEEALYSFLHLDYPEDRCELVIVNDYPLQKLIFDHPRVNIINLDETFSTLGEKENFATKQCKGDIICQWDDDDVALPNHLLNVKKYFVEGTNLLHWGNGIFYNEPNITSLNFIGNSGIVYHRNAWKAIGEYPLENAGYDMTFIEHIHALGNIVIAYTPEEEASWLYMWGGRGYHCSGQGHDTPDRPNIIERHSVYLENQRLLGNIPTGDIILNPHWKYPYDELLVNFIKNKNNAG